MKSFNFHLISLIVALIIIISVPQAAGHTFREFKYGSSAGNNTGMTKGSSKHEEKGLQSFGWAKVTHTGKTTFTAVKEAFGYPAQKAPTASKSNKFTEMVEDVGLRATILAKKGYEKAFGPEVKKTIWGKFVEKIQDANAREEKKARKAYRRSSRAPMKLTWEVIREDILEEIWHFVMGNPALAAVYIALALAVLGASRRYPRYASILLASCPALVQIVAPGSCTPTEIDGGNR